MRSKIQGKVAIALSEKLAEATQVVTLKRVMKVVDKARGAFTETSTDYKGRGVCRLSWTSQEVSALNIPQTDGKAIILQNEIAVQPREGDLIHFGDGFCKIVHVRQDPAQVMWIIQYRKT